MVADTTGRVNLSLRTILQKFFIVTVAPNRASSESHNSDLKKMTSQNQPLLLILSSLDLTAERQSQGKEKVGTR